MSLGFYYQEFHLLLGISSPKLRLLQRCLESCTSFGSKLFSFLIFFETFIQIRIRLSKTLSPFESLTMRAVISMMRLKLAHISLPP